MNNISKTQEFLALLLRGIAAVDPKKNKTFYKKLDTVPMTDQELEAFLIPAMPKLMKEISETEDADNFFEVMKDATGNKNFVKWFDNQIEKYETLAAIMD